jgi:phosphonate transport system substrate-binding protein
MDATRIWRHLSWLPLLLLGLGGPAWADVLRFGIAEAMPFSRPQLDEAWRRYLEPRLGGELRFVRRSSHNDVVSLLMQDRIDFGWICPAHYYRHRERLSRVATPLYHGQPRFQVLLIAPSNAHPPIDELKDLADGVVAFAEPDTALGAAQVKQALRTRGIDPERYFRRVLYTGDHEQVVQAVAEGLAHAGLVMDQVWERLRARRPALGHRIQVIWRSGSRPLPPVVASPSSDKGARVRLREALLEMDSDPLGSEILGALHLDGFTGALPPPFAPSAPLQSGAEAPPLPVCGD